MCKHGIGYTYCASRYKWTYDCCFHGSPSTPVLALLSRLDQRSVISPASTACRFASSSPRKTRVGRNSVHREGVANRASEYSRELSDDDFGRGEEVEDELQTLVDEGRKRQKTVKYHILRRQMTPPGAPPRKLTWNAMEQIKFLKQEQPEEWTVERLAESFSVTTDVILRVLRSKHVPTPERKAKQDAKIIVELGQQVLPSGSWTVQDRLKLPGNRSTAALSSGKSTTAEETLMLPGEGSKSLAWSNVSAVALHNQLRSDISEGVPMTRSMEVNRTIDTNPEEEDTEEEESWDGRVLTEEELEEFTEKEQPSPVVQVGKDFFDAEGNFLYRI